MKKLVSLILVFVLTLSVLVCAQASTISDNQTTRNAETSSAEAEKAQAEPYVVKVYDAASFTDKHSALTNKRGEHVESSAILTTHYLMSDGTWRVQKYDGSGMDDKVFNHRYILSSGNSFDLPLVVLTVNDTEYVNPFNLEKTQEPVSAATLTKARNSGTKHVLLHSSSAMLPLNTLTCRIRFPHTA